MSFHRLHYGCNSGCTQTTEEDADFDIEIDVNNIIAYMYEPLASDSAVEVDEDAEEDVNDKRYSLNWQH